MSITAKGVAIVCGVVLGGFGALGLPIGSNSASEEFYLLASWLMPITLFPAAALAASLDSGTERNFGAQLRTVAPAYAGLVLYGLVVGNHWIEASNGVAHENYAGVLMFAVMAVHAAVLLAGGTLLAVFPKTRPAGFKMWVAYPILLVCWIAGGFLL